MPKKNQKKHSPNKKHTKRPVGCPPGLFSVAITNNNGKTKVSPPLVAHVSKNAKDEVKWHSGAGSFTVKFDKPEGSPFTQSVFNGSPGSPAYSGPVVSTLYRDYNYTAQISGATPVDPIIHTDP
jgi:hypothetical protein